MAENQHPDESSKTKVMDNDFMPLQELVYASLQALEESNIRLHNHAINTIKRLTSNTATNADDIIHLKNLSLAFDQIHPDDDGYCLDKMQLDIPLLSIISLTNLAIEKAEIDFSAEICTEIDNDGKKVINARVTSPEQRDTDHLPHISYKITVASEPGTEGLLRITDIMNTNQIARKTDSTPVSLSGELADESQKKNWKEINHLKTNVKRLTRLYSKISEIFSAQKNIRQGMSNNDKAALLDEQKFEEYKNTIGESIIKFQNQIAELETKSCMESFDQNNNQ